MGGVQRHVVFRIGRIALQLVQDLRLDKGDKDEIDGGIVRYVGRVGADIVWNPMVRQRLVGRVVALTGTSLCG